MTLDRFGQPEPVEPPHNVEAEQALLGAILGNNQVLDRVEGVVQADDFWHPAHQRVFEACLALFAKGHQANAVTLRQRLGPDLDDAGGPDYLARLQVNALSWINARQYAETIADLAFRRRLIEAGRELVAAAQDVEAETTGADVATLALGTLTEVAANATRGAGQGPRDLGDVGNSAMAQVEAAMVRRSSGRMVGLATGIQEVDDALGGLLPGNLYIIGGRPGMGKTAAAEGIAWTAADMESAEAAQEDRKPRVTLFVSGEMSAEQLMKREIARQVGVPLSRLLRGDVTDEQFRASMDVVRRLRGLPLRIDDSPAAVRPASIFARARAMKRRQGLLLLIGDYVQLWEALYQRGRERNRVQELTDITKAAKAIAKDLDVPFLLLAQLRRPQDENNVDRPTVGELKESGSLEQDADVVILLHRQHHYLERSKPEQRANEKAEAFSQRAAIHAKRLELSEGRGEWIIGKDRGGPGRIVSVGWNGPKIQYESLAAAGGPADGEPDGLWERG